MAFAFTATTLKVFVNGSVFASYTGLTIDPTTIQYLLGIAEVPLFIQQMALFNTPLTDAQCISLTADYTDGTSIVGDYERYVSQKSGAVENLSGVTNLIQNLK